MGKRGKGEGEGKGQERGLLGKGRGQDLPRQVGPDWIWEEVIRGEERREKGYGETNHNGKPGRDGE